MSAGVARKPPLTASQIRTLLQPFLHSSDNPVGSRSPCQQTDLLFEQLAIYLDLLIHWNQRTNLTSIQNPEEIVRRHFGESLFLAQHIASRMVNASNLLDFGSGAGFPGLPAKLLCPDWEVTLAESQHKKVSFLREVIRTLKVNCEVWPKRVELWPAQANVTITLRAVDHMSDALRFALQLRPRLVAILTSATLAPELERTTNYSVSIIPVPTRQHQALAVLDRISIGNLDVPRGT